MAKGTRQDYYKTMHKKNLKSFQELAKRILKGIFQIVSIQIDEPQFGHRRVIILIHDKDE